MVKEKGWVAASKLQPGDVVFTSSGGYLKLSSGTWLAEKATVYNITVEGYSTYFVGEAGVWVHNNPCSHASKSADDVLYHYTDEAGAAAISKTGVVKPDSKGRVFVTTDKVKAENASNELFMGRGGTKGTHRVEIKLKNQNDHSLTIEGATQPNELIYKGTVRDGRNAKINVKKNDF